MAHHYCVRSVGEWIRGSADAKRRRIDQLCNRHIPNLETTYHSTTTSLASYHAASQICLLSREARRRDTPPGWRATATRA
jgi:hypothetical protein